MMNDELKNKTAIALEYDPNDEAPKVIASGKGLIAQKIIDAANTSDIPVHQDSELANTLSRLEIGDMIPPSLYEAVAQVLVFVDAMENIRKKQEA